MLGGTRVRRKARRRFYPTPSRASAIPRPTPMHMVQSARDRPRSWSSIAAVSASLAHDMPGGCPRAMALQFGFTKSASPVLIARAAIATASRPDQQGRLMLAPPMVSGSPASSADIRATLRLSSPAWLAHPMITSSTAAGSSEGADAMTARITSPSRSSGRIAASAPPYLPMALRSPSQKSASAKSFSQRGFGVPGPFFRVSVGFAAKPGATCGMVRRSRDQPPDFPGRILETSRPRPPSWLGAGSSAVVSPQRSAGIPFSAKAADKDG